MRTIRLLIALTFACAACFEILADDDVPVASETNRLAFSTIRDEMPSSISAYAELPPPAERLDAKKYDRIAKLFLIRMAKLLRSEQNPDLALVANGLILGHARPTGERGQTEDIAYLPVRLGTNEVLVCATGGPRAKTMFIIRAQASEETTNAAFRVSAIMKQWFKLALDESALSVKEHGKTQTAEVNQSNRTGTVFDTLKATVSPNFICLLFDQYGPRDTVPGMAPSPDEWFEWERSK